MSGQSGAISESHWRGRSSACQGEWGARPKPVIMAPGNDFLLDGQSRHSTHRLAIQHGPGIFQRSDNLSIPNLFPDDILCPSQPAPTRSSSDERKMLLDADRQAV